MPIGRSKRISRSQGPAGPENILDVSLNSIGYLLIFHLLLLYLLIF